MKRGPVLWTYMGPPDKQPPLPEWEFATVPAEQSFVSKRLQESNWLQAMEGGIDSSHVSFLHRGDLGTDPLFKGAKGNQYNMSDMQPYFEVVEQPGGLFIGARRNAENGNYYWRITPFVMPCFTMIPPRGDHPIHGHFWIPIDDENCWAWSYDFHPVRALTRRELDAMRDGAGVHCKYVPGTYRPLANKDNDYLIDRAAQKAGKTFSGVAGFAIQDASLQESMGPICDRTKENLVSTDNGIIMARHRLLRAAKALAEKDVTPPGVDPAHHRVRSASVVLPPDQAFKDAARGGAHLPSWRGADDGVTDGIVCFWPEAGERRPRLNRNGFRRINTPDCISFAKQRERANGLGGFRRQALHARAVRGPCRIRAVERLETFRHHAPQHGGADLGAMGQVRDRPMMPKSATCKTSTRTPRAGMRDHISSSRAISSMASRTSESPAFTRGVSIPVTSGSRWSGTSARRSSTAATGLSCATIRYSPWLTSIAR